MEHPEFEKIVAEHKHLNVLINEQKYSVMSNIKKTDHFTPEFIDWISPKYYEAFLAIYERCIVKNQGTNCAVLRVSFLANKETQEKMAQFLMPHVDKAIENSLEFHRVVKNRKSDLIEVFEKLREPFSYLTAAILRWIHTPEMQENKKVFGDRLLDIADIMKRSSQRHSPIEFGIYEKVTGILQKLDLEEEQVVKVVKHEKKLKRKAVWYILGSVLIFILLLLKWLG